MSARGAWDHRQSDSDVAEHRHTVLIHLIALADEPGRTEQVTAHELAREYPELPVDRWLGVLRAMGRPQHAGDTARSLYPVDLGGDRGPTHAAYALAPAGWVSARRLTAGAVA